MGEEICVGTWCYKDSPDPVALHDTPYRTVLLLALLGLFFVSAAPLFRSVRGQLTTIDGEHLLADQSELITHHHDLSKQVRYGLRGPGDERKAQLRSVSGVGWSVGLGSDFIVIKAWAGFPFFKSNKRCAS